MIDLPSHIACSQRWNSYRHYTLSLTYKALIDALSSIAKFYPCTSVRSLSFSLKSEYTGTDQELRYIKLDFFQASLFYLHKTDQDRTHTDIQNSEFLKASRTFALNSISYPFALQSAFLSLQGFEPGRAIAPIPHCTWNCPLKKRSRGQFVPFKI